MVFHPPVPARGTSDARVFTYREVTIWCASARTEYCGPRKEEATRAEQEPPGYRFPRPFLSMGNVIADVCDVYPSAIDAAGSHETFDVATSAATARRSVCATSYASVVPSARGPGS